MTTRNTKWALVGNEAQCLIIHINKTVVINMDDIDLGDFMGMDEVQQQLLYQGVKKKVGDTVARLKKEKLTPDEMLIAMSAMVDRLFTLRKWTIEGGTRDTISKKKKEADAFVGDRDLKELTKEQLIQALKIVNIGS